MKTIILDSKTINIYFTSDLHLMHGGILKHRTMFSDRDDMNYTLCRNWNYKIPDDIEHTLVFVLGDFCFGGRSEWRNYINRLHGKIWLIQGNHDREKNIPKDISEDKFIWNDGFVNFRIKDDDFKEGEQRVTVCHYPMLSWYQSHRGAWQLFGHIHSGQGSTAKERNLPLRDTQMDVGVDANDYYMPLHWNEIKRRLKKD